MVTPFLNLHEGSHKTDTETKIRPKFPRQHIQQNQVITYPQTPKYSKTLLLLKRQKETESQEILKLITNAHPQKKGAPLKSGGKLS